MFDYIEKSECPKCGGVVEFLDEVWNCFDCGAIFKAVGEEIKADENNTSV